MNIDFVPFSSRHHANYWRGCSTVRIQGGFVLTLTCCAQITGRFYDSWTSGVRFHV